MPREINKTGVIVRDAHLQIDLRAQGFGRERLDLKPTPPNIAYAANLRKKILGQIEAGTFILAEHFPNSPRVKADPASLTWGQLAAEWLGVRERDLAHSTHDHYAQVLNAKHFLDWQSLHLAHLDYRKLAAKLGVLPKNPKTFNNIVGVLKMVLEYGYKSKLLPEPLHQEVEFRRLPKPKPDPFTLAEVEKVLEQIRQPQGVNYYEFAFFSGLRPSEQIALRWADVAADHATVLVHAAITRGKEKGTKTGVERRVQLNQRARAALERQQQIKSGADEFVFLGLGGKPYTTTDGPLDAYWKPALSASKLRYRDARQTRHTFATACLHAGLKPGWVAAQLGHSVEMFYRVYSKWIEDQDGGVERSKLEAFLAAHEATQNVPVASRSSHTAMKFNGLQAPPTGIEPVSSA